MCIFCLLSSFKKEGKIQTGLNCEYDVLSETCLSLSHSRHSEKKMLPWQIEIYSQVKTLEFSKKNSSNNYV